MSNTITVMPSSTQFPIEDNETILDAALRANVILPYGCKDGACGSCKAKYICGDIDIGMNNAMTPDDYQKGMLITCKTTVTSDTTIEAMIADAAFPVKKMPSRILELKRATDDVMVLQLQLPANDDFKFRPGQYIDVILRDGSHRSYSMACAPRLAEKTLELHIRHMVGGVFTDQLFSATKERDILRLEGPHGTFYRNDKSDAPMIRMASGTGFAPIKAIIEDMQAQGIARPIHLYWGGRVPKDLYLNELAEQWAREIPNFKYTPVVSDALPEHNWAGRTGFVHLAIAEDYADLSGHEVYACGAPIVVRSAHDLYTTAHGLPETAFHSDAFLSAKDKVPA